MRRENERKAIMMLRRERKGYKKIYNVECGFVQSVCKSPSSS